MAIANLEEFKARFDKLMADQVEREQAKLARLVAAIRRVLDRRVIRYRFYNRVAGEEFNLQEVLGLYPGPIYVFERGMVGTGYLSLRRYSTDISFFGEEVFTISRLLANGFPDSTTDAQLEAMVLDGWDD